MDTATSHQAPLIEWGARSGVPDMKWLCLQAMVVVVVIIINTITITTTIITINTPTTPTIVIIVIIRENRINSAFRIMLFPKYLQIHPIILTGFLLGLGQRKDSITVFCIILRKRTLDLIFFLASIKARLHWRFLLRF